MSLYYTLRTLSERIFSVRSVIFSLAVSIRQVYLLGQYLYTALSNLAAYIGALAGDVARAADDYLRFRGEVFASLSDNSGIQTLLYYSDILLGIARDPGFFVKSAINQFMPNVRDLNNSPAAFIVNKLISSTGLTYSFMSNPGAFTASMVNMALGDLVNLKNSPRNWIIDKLAQYVPDVRNFLSDPRGWLRLEFAALAPGLSDFLRDPESYITDRAVKGLERLVNTYGLRLAKLAEVIINKMF